MNWSFITTITKNQRNKVDVYNVIKFSDKGHEYFTRKFQKLFRKYKRSDMILECNRYWLEGELYCEARQHHDCFPLFFQAFEKRNHKERGVCFINMDKAKRNVSRYVKRLQKQAFECIIKNYIAQLLEPIHI